MPGFIQKAPFFTPAAGVIPTFTSAGSLGTFQSSTANQSSIAFVTSQAIAIGQLAVLIAALDNNQTTDGDEGAVSSVTDTASNTWSKAIEFCNGQGAAQAGTTCSIWYTKATAALSSGGTITLNLTNNTSRDATAVIGGLFNINAGSTLAVEATNTLANDGAEVGSLDATTANLECLRIRGIASETRSLTGFTPTTNWTDMGQANTTGGPDAGNQTANGEFIISTGTGAASAPTTGSSTDHASAYAAFKST